MSDQDEINENSSELEIVRHALGLALEIIEAADLDLDDEDDAVLDFCARVGAASEAGDMTEIRRELAEEDAEEDDGDNT
jgi:hypothetical protein